MSMRHLLGKIVKILLIIYRDIYKYVHEGIFIGHFPKACRKRIHFRDISDQQLDRKKENY